MDPRSGILPTVRREGGRLNDYKVHPSNTREGSAKSLTPFTKDELAMVKYCEKKGLNKIVEGKAGSCYLLRYLLKFSHPLRWSKYWSWREDLNLQPVVYKLGQEESHNAQEDSSQGKTKNPKISKFRGKRLVGYPPWIS